jgi:molybdate transport system substrate-binding protein
MRTPRRFGGAALAALVLVALLAPAAGTAPRPRTLRVFAAASLADAFGELGHTFEGRVPGLTVKFNFAGSQQLVTQLRQGASADVIASADQRWMDLARGEGLLASEPAVFARNQLVVIVPISNPRHITKLVDLQRGGIKLVLAADSVPAGSYARTVLHKLAGDPALGEKYETRVLANIVSNEENVRAVVAKVQLVEADAGIVYRSDVTPSVARFVTVIEIPESANIVASYPIALVKDGKEPELALAFVNLVRSTEGQNVLKRRGLLPAPVEAR